MGIAEDITLESLLQFLRGESNYKKCQCRLIFRQDGSGWIESEESGGPVGSFGFNAPEEFVDRANSRMEEKLRPETPASKFQSLAETYDNTPF